MQKRMPGIRTHEGKTNPNILLIAPHGFHKDDENTGKLTREIRKKLDCHAIINEIYRKPKELENGEYEKPDVDNVILDLNKASQAKLQKSFLKKIKDLIKDPKNTYVFWIHGIDDNNLAAEAEAIGIDSLKGLIGYGQPNRPSMEQNKAQTFVNHFDALKLKMALAGDASNYRGHNEDNMNQWFRNEGNGCVGVQSVQLEFAFTGIRDDDSIESSSPSIAEAIARLVDAKPVPEQEGVADAELVDKAYSDVRGLIKDNNAMLKVGQYLVQNFYAGNYEWARAKQRYKNKSLIDVINKLNAEGSAPAKTWFYNAVKLAVDQFDCENKDDFRTYGTLGHSHKVYLTHVTDYEQKKILIDETITNKYTVKQLRQRIAEINGTGDVKKVTFQLPAIDAIEKMTFEKREKKRQMVVDRKNNLDKMIEKLMEEINTRKNERKKCESWLKQVSDIDHEQDKAA